jgi:hypothetical protein
MDLAPHLFNERAISFNVPSSSKPKTAREAERAFGDRVREALATGDEMEKLSLISKLLGDVDTRIALVEEERVGLLSVKNELMNEAAKIVANLEDLDSRRVVFHILEDHDRGVESISQSLDMREVLVRSILEALDRELF